MLDPGLRRRQRSVLRFWLPVYRALKASARDNGMSLASFATTPTDQGDLAPQPVATYFDDADRYLDEIVAHAQGDAATRLRPGPATRRLRDPATALIQVFEGTTARTRYEAQRKLYLAKLMFDIDHTRAVRDAGRHRAVLEDLIGRHVWVNLESDEERDLCFVRASVTQRWCFRVRRIKGSDCEPPIDVYEYHTRLKRESTVSTWTSESGPLRVAEQPHWPTMGRRTGSILSKMIRRGIGDAHKIPDLLGALFIVGGRKQAYALERLLVAALGGPFRWRDRTDTMTFSEDHARLTSASSSSFRALKAIVDIPIHDPEGGMMYQCPVEIQILPLPSYLETLSDGHQANHARYKQRQVTQELLPILFPEEIFGQV